MHTPRGPGTKLTDARHWGDPAITEQNPVEPDYILVRDLSLLGVEVLDTGLQGESGFVPDSKNGLPNKSWSASDHFPIAYEIMIQPPCQEATGGEGKANEK